MEVGISSAETLENYKEFWSGWKSNSGSPE
jgi:hypothetical protein